MSRADERHPKLTGEQGMLVIDAMDNARAYVLVKYKPRDEEARENLLAEANLALCVAASRFDPDKGVKFFTYARWWIFKMCNEFIGRDYTIIPSWDIIRNTEQPEVIANVPLANDSDEFSSNVLDLFGVPEEGYGGVADEMYMQWAQGILSNYSVPTVEAWRRSRTHEYQEIDSTTEALVFMLEEELSEGLE